MGDLPPPPPPSLPTYISSLSKTAKRKPLIFNFKWKLKCKKRPPKSSKNQMLTFGLCSTSDDWPSNPSNESQPKCKKGPQSH